MPSASACGVGLWCLLDSRIGWHLFERCALNFLYANTQQHVNFPKDSRARHRIDKAISPEAILDLGAGFQAWLNVWGEE